MATKSHFCEAMLSIGEGCLPASSWPSNQVTSTLNSLPQYAAACLPWAHQVACRPALENAAFNGFSERPISAASAGLTLNPPNSALAAPAVAAACRRSRLVVEDFSVPDIVCSLNMLLPTASLCAPRKRAVNHTRDVRATRGSRLSLLEPRSHADARGRRTATLSPRHATESCLKSSPRKTRAWGMPGARRTRSLVCKGRKHTSSHHRSTENTRHPRTQWF